MKLLAVFLVTSVLAGCVTSGPVDDYCLVNRPIRLSEPTQKVLASGQPGTDEDQIAILAANEYYKVRCR
jgi:hypothetical protein